MLNINRRFLCAPLEDQIEITIFGPGFGEAIACHVGGDNWLLIDSCLNPQSKKPITTDYLRAIGVNAASSVLLVIATHFDNDHIRGLADIVRECSAAIFFASSALHSREFAEFLCKEGIKEDNFKVPSAVREIRQLYDALIENGKVPGYASENKELLFISSMRTGHGCDVRVRALSPSSAVEQNARIEFAKLMPKIGERVVDSKNMLRNDYSVALWIDTGGTRLLLGSDLENVNNSNAGWGAILSNCASLQGQADVFKIPHHGSSNGHHVDIWSRLLQKQPTAILTPYNRGNKLPQPDDVNRILSFTANAHISSSPYKRVGRNVSSQIDALIKRGRSQISPISRTIGAVRARNGGRSSPSTWTIEHLTQDACKLADMPLPSNRRSAKARKSNGRR